MSIRIRSIKMEPFGPIHQQTNYEPGAINLFYGKNESGKSILTRSLLSSLFKLSKDDDPIRNGMTVKVDGISENGVNFTSRGKESIEAYLASLDSSVISDLSRLSVVSQGNLSLDSKSRNNIQVESLRGYFSDQALRTRILAGISATVKSASLSKEGPYGKAAGEFKDINTWEDELLGFDQYLKRVNENFSESGIQTLDQAINETEEELEAINKAKINYAYELHKKNKAHNALVENYPADVINSANNACEKLVDLKNKIENFGTIQQKDFESEISWCSDAQNRLEELKPRTNESKTPPPILLIIIGLALFIGAILSGAFGQQILAATLGVLLFALFVFSSLSKKTTETVIPYPSEVKDILSKFSKMTGKENPATIDIRNHRDSLIRQQSAQTSSIKRNLELEEDIRENENQLRQCCLKLGIEYVSEIEKIRSQLQKLSNKISNSSIDQQANNKILIDLGISEKDSYPIDNADIYKKADEVALSERMVNLKQQRKDISESQDKLVSAGRFNLGVAASEFDIVEILDATLTKREKLVSKIRQKKAEVIAGIVINTYFEELAKREDVDIQTALTQSQIKDYIKFFTTQYDGITFDDENIFIQPNEFPLGDLSTGTKEQILLAIRFGILQYHLGDQQMFIILDDAFQHSDWDRREHLVDALGSLAEMGWQILYFTMDDHIRQLFEERIKPKFGPEFKLFELSNN